MAGENACGLNNGSTVKNALSPETNNQAIQTFIFFDLETVGLSKYDKPKIIEQSLVAISRKDLLYMNEKIKINKNANTSEAGYNKPLVPPLPRILHKYTRLYYPWKLINPTVEDITGLSNFDLEHLQPFTKASVVAFKCFIDLPKPVALVAHNGNSFDFPIIKAEMKNVIADITDFLNFPLRTVDSLLCFRTIDTENDSRDLEMYKKEEERIEVSEIMEICNKMQPDYLNMNNYDRSDSDTASTGGSDVSSETDHFNKESGDDIQQFPVTPAKSESIEAHSVPETPRKKRKGESDDSVTPDSKKHAHSIKKSKDAARRNLSYSANRRTQPYSQPNLYHRIFGTSYDAHKAEADCIALMQICAYYGERFTQWADNNYELFSDVKPMWSKK